MATGLLEGQALTALASAPLAAGEGRAIKRARQALSIHRQTGQLLGEARTLLILSQALDGDEAAACHREAHQILAEICAPPG
ncbi:MAG: hypothetical protein L0Y54_04730 [Sporichthyaceae bacterium]|nr:hypothetical protein [Sporichthyaceae bacterium]